MLRDETTGQTRSYKVAEILAKVVDNRARHQRVYTAALDGYMTETRKQLLAEARKLAPAKDGEKKEAPGRISIHVSPPKDHTRDYDRTILMLKMHQGENITMNETSFARYVLDDWDWKAEWLGIANTYAAGTTQTEYAEF